MTLTGVVGADDAKQVVGVVDVSGNEAHRSAGLSCAVQIVVTTAIRVDDVHNLVAQLTVLASRTFAVVVNGELAPAANVQLFVEKVAELHHVGIPNASQQSVS